MPVRKLEGSELLVSIRRGLAQATRKKEASGAKTLQQIASEVGVDVNTLRRYMDGRFKSIPVDVAVRWAGAVGVSVSIWREEVRARDPFSQILRSLERLPIETADRVAAVLEKRARREIPEFRKREFLERLQYGEITNDLTSTLRAVGAGRDRIQKAISKLDTETIEAIVRYVAREILDRFVVYVRSKRGSR